MRPPGDVVQMWIRAHSWDLSPKDSVPKQLLCPGNVPQLCQRKLNPFVSGGSGSSQSFSGVNAAELVPHRAINQIGLCNERQSRWMERRPFPPSFPCSVPPFPPAKRAFSLCFVGFVFYEVYFHFLCFLGLIGFLSIFETLGGWRTPALSWEGFRTSKPGKVLVQIPNEELQLPCASQTCRFYRSDSTSRKSSSLIAPSLIGYMLSKNWAKIGEKRIKCNVNTNTGSLKDEDR